MPVFKYKDPETGEWISVGGGGSSTEDIVISKEDPVNVDIWIDPDEEADGSGSSSSGIAIGDEEPTGNETVWIDTNEEAAPDDNFYTTEECDQRFSTKEEVEAVEQAVAALPIPLQMKLLWTNPDPATAFASQNITVDFSEYTHVQVEFAQSIWSTTTFASSSIVGKNTSQLMQMPMIDSGKILQLYRTFKAYDTYMAFGSAAYQSPNSSTYAESANSYAIPYKIYGVKGVQ